MGAAYSGARSVGGKVLGVTIPALLEHQCSDPKIFKRGELKLVDTLEKRKEVMITRADVILVAPGGWGTLDEIGTLGVRFKIGEWPAIPVIFLNYEHYWEIPIENQNADFGDGGRAVSIHKPFRPRTKQQTRRIIQPTKHL